MSSITWRPSLREAGREPEVWLAWDPEVRLPRARVRRTSEGYAWVAWLDAETTWAERACSTLEEGVAAASAALGAP